MSSHHKPAAKNNDSFETRHRTEPEHENYMHDTTKEQKTRTPSTRLELMADNQARDDLYK